MKNRLDKTMLDRGLVPSRAKAQELINSNFVTCNGVVVNKSNYMVDDEDRVEILTNDRLKYVSRAGLKLERAIEVFCIDFTNLRVMDIGSSTGGFTDCALQHGAKSVIAIDVGTNLMHESLRNNPKVELHEQTNFKDLDRVYFDNLDIAVCDVSFISLKKILDKIASQNIEIDLVCLIKPQFECGRDVATKYKGVILNKSIHIDIITDLIEYISSLKFSVLGLTYSPIQGGDGNIEYLVYLTNKKKTSINLNIPKLVDLAFNNRG